MTTTGSPLQYRTDPAWATEVMKKPLELLSDHAHLEKKAANNALDLLNKYPYEAVPLAWFQTLSAIAHEETAHLSRVTRILVKRGGRLTKHHRNHYAGALRSHIQKTDIRGEVIDRLLVSALIEARSAERFQLLTGACAEDVVLRELYENLHRSEARHFEAFLKLAHMIAEPVRVQKRWSDWLRIEAQVIQNQRFAPAICSGLPRHLATAE